MQSKSALLLRSAEVVVAIWAVKVKLFVRVYDTVCSSVFNSLGRCCKGFSCTSLCCLPQRSFQVTNTTVSLATRRASGHHDIFWVSVSWEVRSFVCRVAEARARARNLPTQPRVVLVIAVTAFTRFFLYSVNNVPTVHGVPVQANGTHLTQMTVFLDVFFRFRMKASGGWDRRRQNEFIVRGQAWVF